MPCRIIGWPAVVLLIALVWTHDAAGATVPVRFAEGTTRGFLILRSPAGKIIAHGDLLQVPRDGHVESRLVFRFDDGSLYDEVAVFSQNGVFRLSSYRLVQRGPSFPDAMEASLERASRGYRVSTRDGVKTGQIDLPEDTYNGLATILVKNLRRGSGTTVQMVAFTPAPILVPLEMRAIAEEGGTAGGRPVKTTRFHLQPRLGLVKSLLARLVGKSPPDYHCWVVLEGVPAFVAVEGPLYVGGPVWRIEVVSPRGPGAAAR